MSRTIKSNNKKFDVNIKYVVATCFDIYLSFKMYKPNDNNISFDILFLLQEKEIKSYLKMTTKLIQFIYIVCKKNKLNETKKSIEC